MKSNTVIKDTLYPQQLDASTEYKEVILPTSTSLSNDKKTKTNFFQAYGVVLQTLLGVVSYAAGLFILAWWQLAHPSFWLLLLGACGIILGAKLFLFPREHFVNPDPVDHIDFSSMATMAEYLEFPHAESPASNDGIHTSTDTLPQNQGTNNFELLVPYKL